MRSEQLEHLGKIIGLKQAVVVHEHQHVAAGLGYAFQPGMRQSKGRFAQHPAGGMPSQEVLGHFRRRGVVDEQDFPLGLRQRLGCQRSTNPIQTLRVGIVGADDGGYGHAAVRK